MFTLNSKGKLWVIDRPWVMGILNITPDSFYSGSRMKDVSEVLSHAEKMIHDGADIIDIGGQSTRPGSTQVDEEEELKRVIPAVEAITERFPEVLVSIDTFYSRAARYSVEAGAGLINDVSAGSLDPDLLQVVAMLQVPYVLMHMKGHPSTMQAEANYQDVVLEVFDSLNFKLYELISAGIKDIIIDPGFGFAKTIDHNFRLLRSLSKFRELNCPVMVGLSRKGTVYKTLEIDPSEALNGSTVLHTIALLNGANILRVHDVKEAVEAVTLVEKYKEN